MLVHSCAEDIQPIFFDWESIVVDEQKVLVLVGHSSEVAGKVVEAVDMLLGREDIIPVSIGRHFGETMEWLRFFAIQNCHMVEVFGGRFKKLEL